MRARIPLTSAILVFVLTACSLLPASMKPVRVTSAPTRTPAATRPLPSTATPAVPVPTATPAIPLASSGPWLTYLSSSNVGGEVVVSNPDGSGRTVIGALPDVFVPLFSRPTNPGTRWFSLQNGRDQSITIFQLPEGKAVKAYSLLSNTELKPDQRSFYASILNQKTPASQAWSPDGQSLAFTAAMDGPYTDLYIFDTRDSSLRRLTENIGQSFYPVWSPDGKWVIVQEVDTSQSSGTAHTVAVYAFSPDGVSMHYLYNPSSLGEQIFGWLDPDTFVVASRRQMGLTDARRFKMEKRQLAQLQYSGQMDQAVLDPGTGTLFFSVIPKDKDVPSLLAGLYWTSPATGPVPVSKGKWQRLDWQPNAGFFAFGTGGLISYHIGGEKVIFEGEDTLPAASPDGKHLAFYSAESGMKPGLRLVSPDGKQVEPVTDQAVQEVLWRPDSAGLFFVSGGDLYYLNIQNNAKPQKLETGASNLGWVGAP